MMPPFGEVPFARLKAAYDELRAACRAEGTPRIQDAIDAWEPLADFAFQRPTLSEADIAEVRAWWDVLPTTRAVRQDLCSTCAQDLGGPHMLDCPYG
jgi:hypothetical protein